jgi:leader peptidase (prepilin peptidase)/N-methyltransferase
MVNQKVSKLGSLKFAGKGGQMPALSSVGMLVVTAMVGGLGAGMLINVLADVLPRDELTWRLDGCQKCGHRLPGRWVLPVLGFALLGGCCPSCGERLPRRHLWVAAAAPLALLLIAWRVAVQPPGVLPLAGRFALYALAALVLLLIFVIDLEHHLILDVVTYPAIVALLMLGGVVNHQLLFLMLMGALIAGGLFALFYGLAYLRYHTDALGLGDVKLAVLLGLLTGWPMVLSALFYGTLAGAATGMVLMMTGKADRQTMIPLGTGLSVGTFLALLFLPLLW